MSSSYETYGGNGLSAEKLKLRLIVDITHCNALLSDPFVTLITAAMRDMTIINPIPHVGQPVKLSYWRFVPNYEKNPTATIVFIDREKRIALVQRSVDDDRVVRTWLMPDGSLSRINLTPMAQYATKLDRLVYHRQGGFIVRGQYPDFYLPERNGQRVWMDYDRSFVFTPVDFAARADAWHRELKKMSRARGTKT